MCTVMNTVVCILSVKKNVRISNYVHCSKIFSFPLKHYTMELKNILRMFSVSNHSRNKKAQPHRKLDVLIKKCASYHYTTQHPTSFIVLCTVLNTSLFIPSIINTQSLSRDWEGKTAICVHVPLLSTVMGHF